MRIKSRRKEGVPIQLDHIYTGDCLEVLKTLPDESVHCCITSPPYYALRDYGVDGQIGREATPKEYISRLTEVFAEVRRVLRSDGTLWLNISDTYAGKGNQGGYVDAKNPKGRNGQAVALNYKVEGCKPKDMIGIPWMLAFSLRDSGWYLRNDIIWMKENRCRKASKTAAPAAMNTSSCSQSHGSISLTTGQSPSRLLPERQAGSSVGSREATNTGCLSPDRQSSKPSIFTGNMARSQMT